MIAPARLPTYHVPSELADELVSAGLAQPYVPPAASTGATGMLCLTDASAAALIILDVSGQVVTLTGITPPLEAIAHRIGAWRSRKGVTERKYAILAIGPKGQFRLDLDEKPDLKAVMKLLRCAYGDDD